MVQALYLRRRFQHSIVHCLTDLHTLYTQQKRLHIEKYVFFSCNSTTVDLMCPYVKPWHGTPDERADFAPVSIVRRNRAEESESESEQSAGGKMVCEAKTMLA